MQDFRKVARTFMIAIATILLGVILLSLLAPVHPAAPVIQEQGPARDPGPPAQPAPKQPEITNISGSAITGPIASPIAGGSAGGDPGGSGPGVTPPIPPVIPVNPTPPVPEFSSVAIPSGLITGFLGVVIYIKKVRTGR